MYTVTKMIAPNKVIDTEELGSLPKTKEEHKSAIKSLPITM